MPEEFQKIGREKSSMNEELTLSHEKTVAQPHQEKKIVIHGSCITRDIFRIHPKGFNIVKYFARSCLSSLISTPITITENDLIGLTSNFQKQMVINDFKKILFQTVECLEFDYFLIDLIDERFNILQIGSSFITKSAELINSKYLGSSHMKFAEIQRLSFSMDKWKADCDRYLQLLTQVVPPEKIIIIRGQWAEKYQSTSGAICEFNHNKIFPIDYIKKMNFQLENYYNYLKCKLPQSTCIPYLTAIANENHEWGLSPFHYLTEQYDHIYSELCSFIFQGKTTEPSKNIF